MDTHNVKLYELGDLSFSEKSLMWTINKQHNVTCWETDTNFKNTQK